MLILVYKINLLVNDCYRESDSEMKDNASEDISEDDLLVDGDTSDEESAEIQSKALSIDYRLRDFKDLGRYQKNNPGSYYDHSENAWFCSICVKLCFWSQLNRCVTFLCLADFGKKSCLFCSQDEHEN